MNGMGSYQFEWVPFYKEVAREMLNYKQNRKDVLKWIYEKINEQFVSYLHDSDKERLTDIDPFTVMGIFNRGIKNDNRILIAEEFKKFFSVKEHVPKNFYGIPVLFNTMSHFFSFKGNRQKSDIDNLWNLFEQALENGSDLEVIFNKVRKQYGININVTMGLYWISPETFLSFDSKNRIYLYKRYKINIGSKLPNYREYISIVDDIRNKMKKGIIRENSFPELSYNAWMENLDSEDDVKMPEAWRKQVVELWRHKKNIILQGAPGIGKTYEIPELVVRLCDRFSEVINRSSIVAEYEKLVKEGRVVFTTFHQSMDYEDFVEGIKPVIVDDCVNYEIVDGVFKKLCNIAQNQIEYNNVLGIGKNPAVWKVSLVSTYDNPVRTDCLKNGYIRIGWDAYGETIEEDTKYESGGRIVLDAFINRMQLGDIVMSCYSNRVIDAIGIVTGEYYWNASFTQYKRVRSVRWLVKDIREDIYELNNHKAMTLSTVYRLNNISLNDVMGLLEKYKVINRSSISKNEEPFILVIDEINRGNISKIFGELITLLEPDKRMGEESRLEVTLPYSRESFKVPSNVYVIATMNTADRSLGVIDYAIRRRFAFVRMNPHSLEKVEGFNEELFRKVSELFVSNYDECSVDKYFPEPSEHLSDEFRPDDVWIGHSYFIMIDKNGKDITRQRLRYEIIPILYEYLRDGVFRNTKKVEDVIHELNEYVNN